MRPTETCRAAIYKYWPKDTLNTALRVSELESGQNATEHNGNANTGDDSWGCFQVNRYGNLAKYRPSAEWLVQPDNNVRYAVMLYRLQGWKPWTNTAHKLNLPL